MVPELEPHCWSWIVVSRATCLPVLETYSRKIAEAVNTESTVLPTKALADNERLFVNAYLKNGCNTMQAWIDKGRCLVRLATGRLVLCSKDSFIEDKPEKEDKAKVLSPAKIRLAESLALLDGLTI